MPIAILLFFSMWDNEVLIYPPFYLSLFPYSFFPLALIRIDEKNISKCWFSFSSLEATGLPEGSQKTKFLLSDLVMFSAIVLNFSLFQIVIIKRVPIKWFPFVRWIIFYNVAKFYTCYESPGQCQQNVGTFSPQQLKTAEEGHLMAIWEETNVAFSQWPPILECQQGVLFQLRASALYEIGI